MSQINYDADSTQLKVLNAIDPAVRVALSIKNIMIAHKILEYI